MGAGAVWFVIKFMSDLRRREPRNVGIALQTSEGLYLRFFGELPDGRIDGRRLRVLGAPADVYRSWVEYLQRKAWAGEWADVLDVKGRRPRPFFVETGGRLLGEVDDPRRALDDLYDEYVSLDSGSDRVEDSLKRAVRELFQELSITPEQNVSVRARWDDAHALTEVPFHLRYVNGQPHLMQRVRLNSGNAESGAREIWARMVAARKAGSAHSFVAFYSSSECDDSERLDAVLAPLEAAAHTVNVDDGPEALKQLDALMGSGVAH